MEPETKFTYSLVFQLVDSFGCLRDYVDTLWFEELLTARRAHSTACSGSWVKQGYRHPHVTALKVVKHGRVLAEDLALKADYCEDCRTWKCVCEETLRRRAAA